jgi:hypothetical protein
MKASAISDHPEDDARLFAGHSLSRRAGLLRHRHVRNITLHNRRVQGATVANGIQKADYAPLPRLAANSGPPPHESNFDPAKLIEKATGSIPATTDYLPISKSRYWHMIPDATLFIVTRESTAPGKTTQAKRLRRVVTSCCRECLWPRTDRRPVGAKLRASAATGRLSRRTNDFINDRGQHVDSGAQTHKDTGQLSCHGRVNR